MSLQQAISDIADRIDSDVENLTLDNITIVLLKGLSRELRTAVKASEGSNPLMQQSFMTNEMMIEKEREKIRREKAEKGDEGPSERMVEMITPDSEDVPILVAIDGKMPQGARTVIGKSVYILGTDSKLHFSREETETFHQKNTHG